jgi:hypothetical protein
MVCPYPIVHHIAAGVDHGANHRDRLKLGVVKGEKKDWRQDSEPENR